MYNNLVRRVKLLSPLFEELQDREEELGEEEVRGFEKVALDSARELLRSVNEGSKLFQEKKIKKEVTLMGFDGEVVVVEKSIAIMSQTIRHMVDDDCASEIIPLPNVDGKTLLMVIEYCKKHADLESKSDDLKAFDSEFVDKDQAVLYDLIMAADYLNIKSLLNLICEKVASMIRGKSPEEIRRTFNIVNDFSPEEEAKLRQANSWAFE